MRPISDSWEALLNTISVSYMWLFTGWVMWSSVRLYQTCVSYTTAGDKQYGNFLLELSSSIAGTRVVICGFVVRFKYENVKSFKHNGWQTACSTRRYHSYRFLFLKLCWFSFVTSNVEVQRSENAFQHIENHGGLLSVPSAVFAVPYSYTQCGTAHSRIY